MLGTFALAPARACKNNALFLLSYHVYRAVYLARTRYTLNVCDDVKGNGEKTENMKIITNERSYARMGIAAMIPGLQRAAELLTAEVAKFKALLDDDATERQIENVTATKRGGGSSGHKAYWAAMTPEEKRAEMLRRGLIFAGQQKKPRKAGTGSYWDKPNPGTTQGGNDAAATGA